MTEPARVTKPRRNRIVDHRGNLSLKLSIGKEKMHADPWMSRQMYNNAFYINGAQYCRPHLLFRCHLCEVDCNDLKEEVDEERRQLGLRPSGVENFNQYADKWGFRTKEALLTMTLQDDLARQMNGKDYYTKNPHLWQERRREMDEIERDINVPFLQEVAEMKEMGATECCYWACTTPNGDNLLRCVGCKIARYCCKEHQAKDWKWEHRGECTVNVPEFVLDEIEGDRQRHLSGDYSHIEHADRLDPTRT
jgi:hypothetical protein